jgi:hypothetical protein
MPSDQPTAFDAIKKDAKLCAALMGYMNRTYSIESFKFYYDKGNAAGIYPKYIEDKAPLQVNIKAKTKKAADLLAKTGDFDNKAWEKIISKAKEEVQDMCRLDVFPEFYKSKEYQDYCKKEKMGDPKKAAKVLGISNIKLLTQAMEAAATGDDKEAKKLLEKLAKEEKIKSDYEAMIKALEKANLI